MRVACEVRELRRLGYLFPLILTLILVIVPGCGRFFTVGAINVNATLDGAPWSGAVDCTVKKSGGGTDHFSAVPKSWPQMPTGTYTLYYNSGGPSGATLASITPSATQTLSTGGTVTFTLNFSSGPAVTPTPTPTPKPTFELTGWEFATEMAAIDISYSVNTDVMITLIDPTGKVIDDDMANEFSDSSRLGMSYDPSFITPMGGTYEMVVTHDDEEIYKKTFAFEGAKFCISGLSCTPHPFSPEAEMPGKYAGISITVTLANDGDLPVYFADIDANVDGKEQLYFTNVCGWLMPHTHQTTDATAAHTYEAGVTHMLNITVLDYEGKAIAASSLIMPLP